VLSLDADERLTPELRSEIAAKLSQPGAHTCFSITRLSWYCGRFIKHSGWNPDYVDRLFLRGSARFSDDLVHERLLTKGPVLKLENHMLHYSYLDYSQVLQKIDRYSSASAKQAFANGKKGSIVTAILHGLWAFIKTYFIKVGFLDGSHGLALAISNAEVSYYRYLKLWLLEAQKKNGE